MDVTITVQRLSEAESYLRSLSTRMDRGWTDAAKAELELIVAMLEGQVKLRTPVVTGILRDSVFSEVNTQGVSVEGLVSTPIVYGPPVEFGRKANDSGKGGFEGRHMFEDAWQENSGKVASMLNRVGVTLAQELLKKL